MSRARSRKTWQDLSPGQRGAALIAGAVQFALLIAAQRDLSRRPDDQVRGRKLWWRVAAFVNFVGPISYFLFGPIESGLGLRRGLEALAPAGRDQRREKRNRRPEPEPLSIS